MQATALTFTLVGLDAHPIRVEVDSGRGVANFLLVGLAEASVRESRVRVRAALQQIGVDLAEYVITVNLGPADLKKSGGAFDVAIAAATLGALGKIPAGALDGVALLGELSLTGALRPVRGVLPALRGAVARGVTRAVVPRDNAREAAAVPGIAVGVADHLSEILRHFQAGRAARRAGGAALVCAGVRAGERGSRGRARAARGAAGAGGGGGRGAQPHLHGTAGGREDDARPAIAHDHATDVARRGAGGDRRTLGVGAAQPRARHPRGAAVPRAAPHGERRGPGGRRRSGAAGRGVARAPGAACSSTSCWSSRGVCWSRCGSRSRTGR